MTAFPSGVWGSHVETIEAVAPVLFERRELRVDSGGAGRMRGGLGQRIEVTAAGDQDVMLFLSVGRILNPAKGRHGGKDGAPGRIRIGEDGADLPGKGEVRVPGSTTLVFETPDGGGFRTPAERTNAAAARDVKEGLVSPTGAATYGERT